MRIQARYWIETAFPLEDAAAIMAGEQSTGTFIKVPGETDELRERFAARVEQITELGTVGTALAARVGSTKEFLRHDYAVPRRSRFHGLWTIPALPSPTWWLR